MPYAFLRQWTMHAINYEAINSRVHCSHMLPCGSGHKGASVWGLLADNPHTEAPLCPTHAAEGFFNPQLDSTCIYKC